MRGGMVSSEVLVLERTMQHEDGLSDGRPFPKTALCTTEP